MKPVPPGPQPSRAGVALTAAEVALLTLIALVAVTGLSLSFTFSPSVTHAWSSIAFLERAVPLGRLVRAVHHDATQLLVVFGLVYLGALAVSGYPRRAPLGWIGRVIVAALVIGSAHVGLLLPADGRAMAATHELLSIAGSVPFVGGATASILRGGPAYGHLTLVHLNALHTLVLPLLLGAAVWWIGSRGAGIAAGRPALLVGVALLTVIASFVFAAIHPAPLWAPGDPTHPFPARPEWLLLPIFQLRRHMGSAEALATVVLPGLLLLGALALTRAPTSVARAFVATVAIGFAGLLGWALHQDARDPQLARMRVDARREASDAVRLAALGLSEEGPLSWDRNDPVVYGRHLFAQRCAVCHHAADERPYKGDLMLQGYGSRAWLEALLGHLRSPYFFGNGKIDGMDDVPAGPRRTAIVEYLVSLGHPDGVDTALAEQGRKLFADDGCESCHSVDGKGGNGASDLKGYGSEAWLEAFIRAPGNDRFYGDQNEMRRFGPERLADDELHAVVAYVRSRAQEPVNIPVTPAVQGGKVDSKETSR